MVDQKRLHISPLTPDTLSTVLRSDLQQLATEISFHSIQTYPEKSYGYVTLPVSEADRLKKKFHGSVLRGCKMRVEDAKPKKQVASASPSEVSEPRKTRQAKDSTKSSKNEQDGVLAGVEVPGSRKVKRGWAKPEPPKGGKKGRGDKASKAGRETRSKTTSTTGQSECLFKTSLPPTAQAEAKVSSERSGRTKKRKRTDPDGKVVVHEFANNTKQASFLRDKSGAADKKPSKEYVEGQGWVDEDDNLIEAEPPRKVRQRSSGKNQKDSKTKKAPANGKSGNARPDPAEIEKNADSTSSSGISSSSESEESDNEAVASSPAGADVEIRNGSNAAAADVSRLSISRSPPPRHSTSSPSPLTTAIETAAVESSNPINSAQNSALETLFKRPAAPSSTSTTTTTTTTTTMLKPAAPTSTPKKPPPLDVPSSSFRFFDNAADADDNDDDDDGEDGTNPEGENGSSTTKTKIKRERHSNGPRSSLMQGLATPGLAVPTPSSHRFMAGGGVTIPQTPISLQDFRSRRQRSAAPTPDTAAPGRTFGDVFAGLPPSSSFDDDDDVDEEDENEGEAEGLGLHEDNDDDMDEDREDDDDDDDTETETKTTKQTPKSKPKKGKGEGTGEGEGVEEKEKEKEESEFATWFWANRGENNRAWKRRRREVAREAKKKNSSSTMPTTEARGGAGAGRGRAGGVGTRGRGREKRG